MAKFREESSRTILISSLRIAALFFAAPIFTLSANSITVPNFSFESPALPNGANNNGGNGDTTAIPGWTISAPAASGNNNGVYHPSAGFTSTNPLPAPADGNQVAYLFPGAAANSCSITTTNSLGLIAANTDYLLTVALGNRNDNLFFDTGTYTIDLLANGVSIAESALTGSAITHGTFTDLSASFLATSGPLIGESLTIRLSATAGSNNDEGIFDNVRLTASPVGLPDVGGTMMLLGIGMVGIGMLHLQLGCRRGQISANVQR